MKKNLVIIGIVSLGLFACKSEEKPSESADGTPKKEQKDEPTVAVNADRVLNLELEGMVCQMGCGGAIRKELNATGAVANCEFDFEEDRAMDVAKIEFDKDKITADEIVKIVSEINDGQFKVGKVSSEDLATTDIVNETPNTTKSVEKPKATMSVSTSSMPNLFDLFSGLLSV